MVPLNRPLLSILAVVILVVDLANTIIAAAFGNGGVTTAVKLIQFVPVMGVQGQCLESCGVGFSAASRMSIVR